MKSTVKYSASKGYKHWAGVIENLEEIDEKVWRTDYPNKKWYASKCLTKIKGEGGDNILGQK